MTLEEAIIHCKEKACDNTQCALEHRQLAEWLEELKQKKKYKLTELEQFVHDHIQQKIDNNELHLTGIKMDGNDPETFKREFEIYENALLEGIINGIVMCGGEIEGLETD